MGLAQDSRVFGGLIFIFSLIVFSKHLPVKIALSRVVHYWQHAVGILVTKPISGGM
jgi:hypothetical protein